MTWAYKFWFDHKKCTQIALNIGKTPYFVGEKIQFGLSNTNLDSSQISNATNGKDIKTILINRSIQICLNIFWCSTGFHTSIISANFLFEAPPQMI